MYTTKNIPELPQPRPPARPPRGLTLLETALATLIVGVAVLALINLAVTVTGQNVVTQRMTLGLQLAGNVREMMAGLPYNSPTIGNHLGVPNGTPLSAFNNVQDFDGFIACPPVDAHRQPIPELTQWRQQVIVQHVNPSNYTLIDPVPIDSACSVDRVQVIVSYQPPGTATWIQVVTMEWLKTK